MPHQINLLISLAEDRELMLRATAGNGISVRDTWLGTTKPPPAEDACISMATGACSTHYRNPKIDLWNTLPIVQVHDLIKNVILKFD